MESKNSILAKGLKSIRTANILTIVSAILLAVGMVVAVIGGAVAIGGGALSATGVAEVDPASLTGGGIVTAGIGGIITIIASLMMFASFIIQLLGLIKAGKVHSGYKNAMMIVVINIVLNALTFVEVLAPIITIITPAVNFLMLYFIITTTVVLLKDNNEGDVSLKGTKVVKLYLIFSVVSVVGNVLALIPSLATISGLCVSVAGIGLLVCLIQYIGFLGRSSNFFASQPN